MSDGEPSEVPVDVDSSGSASTASISSRQADERAPVPVPSSSNREPDWVAWTEHTHATGTHHHPESPARASSPIPALNSCCSAILSDAPLLLLFSSVILNSGLLIAAIFVYATTSSQLVLAQAADSFLDVGANLVVAFATRVSRRPADLDHLYGHQRAEPIGALIVAVITVVVAIQVFASAVQSLAAAAYPPADIAIAAVLGAKGGMKLGLIAAILFVTKFRPSDNVALNALFVDTRNDVVACIASLGGFGLTAAGYGWGDGLLAILLSIYVAYNGIDLGRDNLAYLMGGAPSREVMDELRSIARRVQGVSSVGRIRAQYIGQDLQVDICVVVPSDVLVGEAHDVSVNVQRALEGDQRVAVAFVHVDTDETAVRDH